MKRVITGRHVASIVGGVKCKALGRISGSATQIIDALFEIPIASVNKLVEKTLLTPATVNKVLNALEHELGIVKEATGQKRNRIYAYSAYIKLLNQE